MNTKYKDLISKIKNNELFKKWKKQGDTFYFKDENDNYLMLNFQKSRSSTEDITKFTLNMGIYFNKAREYDGEELHKTPTFYQCHWIMRIGHYLPIPNDVWWDIDKITDIDLLSEEIVEIVKNYLLPVYDKKINNFTIEDYINRNLNKYV